MKRTLIILSKAIGFAVLIILLLSPAASPGSAQASGYELIWSSFGGAGGTSSGGGYEMHGQSGQFSPGIISGGDYTITMFPVTPAALIRGDVNGDGRIDGNDVTLVLRHTAGLVTLTGTGFAAADVNQDGRADIADAVLILRYIAGLSSFPP